MVLGRWEEVTGYSRYNPLKKKIQNMKGKDTYQVRQGSCHQT